MRTMNIKEARSSFSRLVDGAERGECVIITRHGRQAACLIPVTSNVRKLQSLSGFRAGLHKAGLSASVIAARQAERF